MDYRLAKYAASGAIIGLLGVGSATIASAQDRTTTSSSSTVESSTDGATADASATDHAPDTHHDGEDCPEHTGDDAGATDSTDATADPAG